jgi:hypothetical protein
VCRGSERSRPVGPTKLFRVRGAPKWRARLLADSHARLRHDHSSGSRAAAMNIHAGDLFTVGEQRAALSFRRDRKT